MAEKTLQCRLINKHDTAAKWADNTTFIPLKGEVIVYDVDDDYDYERIKVGDGIKTVNELPFVNDAITNSEIDALCGSAAYSIEWIDI